MDKIYEDFTTKFLPQIQEGLVITKDYSADLFSRYVKYLIVTDTIGLVCGVLLIIVAIVIFVYARKSWKAREEWAKVWRSNERVMEGLLSFAASFMVIFGFLMTAHYSNSLIKDIYLPEVRVYEESKPMMK